MDLQCRECGSHTSEKVRKMTLTEEVCTVALVRQRRGQMENSSVPSVMSWHSQMANRFWERTVDYCWLLSRQKSSLAPSCTSFPLPNPPLLVPNLHQRAPSGTVFLIEVDTHSEWAGSVGTVGHVGAGQEGTLKSGKFSLGIFHMAYSLHPGHIWRLLEPPLKLSWSLLMNSIQGTRGRSDVFPNDGGGAAAGVNFLFFFYIPTSLEFHKEKLWWKERKREGEREEGSEEGRKEGKEGRKEGGMRLSSSCQAEQGRLKCCPLPEFRSNRSKSKERRSQG